MGDRFGQEGQQPSRDISSVSAHPMTDFDDSEEFTALSTAHHHRASSKDLRKLQKGGL